MEFNFSERMNGLDGSATREIFKLLSRPEIVSFAGGLPANEYLPIKEVGEICAEILSSDKARAALQYGTTEGFLDFRQELIKYVAISGVEAKSVSETLVISGGQQAIDLMLKSFVNKGDYVLVEDPTYLAFLQILKSYQGNAVGVKANPDGLDLADLEEKIKKYKPKMLYVVTTFSNPTGKTYSAQNRKEIARITAKYGVMVLEDDPYSKLRFSGSPVPALKSFDTCGNIVYVTSFSKVLSPGLRCGVAVGDERVIRKMTICKQGTDLHTSNLSQAITHEYLKKGCLMPNIEKSLPVYRMRKAAMMDAIEKYMPAEFKHTDPDGGLFVWGEFDADIDTRVYFKQAIEQNVAYIQGAVFYANEEDGKRTLRLNFSNESPERIENGIKALGGLYKRIIGRG